MIEGSFSEFLWVLGAVFFAEIGDKTMLVTVALAGTYHWRKVLMGIVPACISVPIIGIGIALVAKVWLPEFWLQIISATLFFGLFIWSMNEARKEESADYDPRWWHRFGPVGISFFAFFMAEMWDRTQFVTITVTISGGSVLADWFGSAGGLILANLIALAVTVKLKKRIPRQQLMYGAGVLFLASSAWMYADAFDANTTRWISGAAVCIFGFNPSMYRLTARTLHFPVPLRAVDASA